MPLFFLGGAWDELCVCGINFSRGGMQNETEEGRVMRISVVHSPPAPLFCAATRDTVGPTTDKGMSDLSSPITPKG